VKINVFQTYKGDDNRGKLFLFSSVDGPGSCPDCSFPSGPGFPVSFQADYGDSSEDEVVKRKYYAGPEVLRMEGVADGKPGLRPKLSILQLVDL